MKKTTIGIIIVIIVSFLGLVGYKMWSTTNFEKYDLNRIIPANEDNGQIGVHVLGKADAPVLLFEYGDFQCEGCASLNPILQTLVKEFEGKVGIVMRYFLLSYHQNATAAASAAEAAGKQGYYENLLTCYLKISRFGIMLE